MYDNIRGYCFLNNTYTMVYVLRDVDPVTNENAAHVWPALHVVDLSIGEVVLQLEYAIMPNCSVHDILFDMKTDYNATHPSSWGNFHTSSRDRLVVVTCEDVIGHSRQTLIHVFPVSYILALTQEHGRQPAQSDNLEPPPTLRFADWAENNRTRLFIRRTTPSFFINVQGMRVLMTGEEHDTKDVLFYDFHQPSVRTLSRHQRSGRMLQGIGGEVVSAKSTITVGERSLMKKNINERTFVLFRISPSIHVSCRKKLFLHWTSVLSPQRNNPD